jgi:protoheme ferro-lyase
MERLEPYMTVEFMEAFAGYTTQELGLDDPSKAVAHLNYMSNKLRTATPLEYEFIDVYYVECLFWQASSRAIKQGWKLVPENLKSLYLAFHGKPPQTKK